MANGARAIIENTLAEYGLATGMANDGKALADWAWDRYLDTGDADQVMVELRSQQAFKDRFPAYDELAKAGRALSPAEYVAYEKAVYAQFQSYGVPGGILDDKETITEMLLNDVSAAEVSGRLALNAQATLTEFRSIEIGTEIGSSLGFLLVHLSLESYVSNWARKIGVFPSVRHLTRRANGRRIVSPLSLPSA